ncbi:MAG: Trp family transcriptional regulator [Patescibacteria group bacterium]
MPHVSKKRLSRKTQGKIFSKLIVVLGHARNHRDLAYELDELLTETEKIMLAKRLAIIFMLDSNIPQHRISDALSVSLSTVTRFSLGVEEGKYDFIRNISKKDKVDFEKIIWLLLTAGGILPPRVGRKYWRKKGYRYALET